MTHILILGANGQLARHATTFFLDRTDAHLTLCLRRAGRLENPDPRRVTVVEGDVLNSKILTAAMHGQDVVYANPRANLAGDMAAGAPIGLCCCVSYHSQRQRIPANDAQPTSWFA